VHNRSYKQISPPHHIFIVFVDNKTIPVITDASCHLKLMFYFSHTIESSKFYSSVGQQYSNWPWLNGASSSADSTTSLSCPSSSIHCLPSLTASQRDKGQTPAASTDELSQSDATTQQNLKAHKFNTHTLGFVYMIYLCMGIVD